jgi:hypothetical protein
MWLELLIAIGLAFAVALPGAVLEGGILGTVRNKVGNVIAATWKGVNYVKAYAVPANPNTAAQQTQRTFFAAIVRAAQLILTTVIQPWWDPFATKQSGFSRFMQVNLLGMSTPFDYADMVVSQGNLESETPTVVTYDTATGIFNCDWTPSGLGNGENTDDAHVIVYDPANDIAFVDAGSQRVDEGSSFNIGTGRTATQMACYLFFTAGTGVDAEVSDSVYHAVAAA